MLSNHDIDELVVKMGIPNFKGCYFKDTLKKIEPNSSYILNLNSEYNEKNERNKGSHWVALITDDMKRGIYFDSYGEREPTQIKNLLNVISINWVIRVKIYNLSCLIYVGSSV